MLYLRVSKIPRKSVSEAQWLAAADAYELGTKHASQIARELGVSASTVSREFKRRGCVKACRVEESIAPLVAELDARDRVRTMRLHAEIDAAAERRATLDRLMDQMMKSLVAADKTGNLAAANPVIDQVRRSLDR
jgi:IS30 family transposase